MSIPAGAVVFGGNVGVPTQYATLTINSANLTLNTLAFSGDLGGVHDGDSVAGRIGPVGGELCRRRWDAIDHAWCRHLCGRAFHRRQVGALDTQNGNVIIAGPIDDNSPVTLGKKGGYDGGIADDRWHASLHKHSDAGSADHAYDSGGSNRRQYAYWRRQRVDH